MKNECTLFNTFRSEYLIPLGRGEYLLVFGDIEIVGPCDSLYPVSIGLKARFMQERTKWINVGLQEMVRSLNQGGLMTEKDYSYIIYQRCDKCRKEDRMENMKPFMLYNGRLLNLCLDCFRPMMGIYNEITVYAGKNQVD